MRDTASVNRDVELGYVSKQQASESYRMAVTDKE
jgi:N-methylhydantoinase B/oxoprolinase/acetone carboxylase alpha subunit